MLYVQMMGRGLRTSPETGKVDCIIIDHSTTSRDLGCLKEIDREALDDGEEGAGEAKRKEREKAPPKLQECKTCPTLSPAHVAECISCGTPFPIRRVVDVVDGELEVLSGSGGVSRGKAEPVVERLRKLGRERVGAMLNFMKATRKGNRDSWARHRMGDIFGKKPRHETMSSFGLEPPCPELETWVRSRDIAWSKSQGRYSVGAGAGYAH